MFWAAALKFKTIFLVKGCHFTHDCGRVRLSSKCVKMNKTWKNVQKSGKMGVWKAGRIDLLTGHHGGKRRERKKRKKRRRGRDGGWKVSVRDASLLEDNPRAGPVRFKSNQSIRINYPPPPTPQLYDSRCAHGGEDVCVRAQGAGVDVVLCFLFHPHTHTQPPHPHLLRWKKRTNKNQAIKGFSLSLNKLNADFCFKWRPPFVRRGTGFFIVPLSLVLWTTLSGERTANRAVPPHTGSVHESCFQIF